MMRDRPYLDEHSDLVTAGLLAEDVIFAVNSLKRGAGISESERRALNSARTLLTFILAPEVRHVAHHGISNLSGSTGALEFLKVAESQRPRSEVRQFLQSLTDLVDRALIGADVSAEDHSLAALQQLFAGLGNVALARANSLSLAGDERLYWPNATTTLAS